MMRRDSRRMRWSGMQRMLWDGRQLEQTTGCGTRVDYDDNTGEIHTTTMRYCELTIYDGSR